MERFDTIIVGGGSAGCVLANRLSENKSHQVLVLEAGRPDSIWDIFIHMPAGLAFPIGNRFYDWGYRSEPEPFMNGRTVYHARGKLLGGHIFQMVSFVDDHAVIGGEDAFFSFRVFSALC
jgi:choline dehydrogenase